MAISGEGAPAAAAPGQGLRAAASPGEVVPAAAAASSEETVSLERPKGHQNHLVFFSSDMIAGAKKLRPQLYSASEYCEKSYLHSEQKQM